MKTMKLTAAVMVMAIAAFAQHGGGHAGGAGMGASGMGSGHNMGAASATGHSTGMDSAQNANAGKQSPDQILTRNTKLSSNHANLQREELKLEPLLEADTPDEGAVLSAIDRITAARASMEKANAQMAFAIRRVLTPDQWKKLRALRPKRDHFPQPMRGPQGRMMMERRGGQMPDPPSPPDRAPSPDTAK